MKRCAYCLEPIADNAVSFLVTVSIDVPGPGHLNTVKRMCADCHDKREEKRERREAAEEDRRDR